MDANDLIQDVATGVLLATGLIIMGLIATWVSDGVTNRLLDEERRQKGKGNAEEHDPR